ncbi:MAG: hypothetical protein JWL61_1523 [Gemmatimonadetes bacterium]|nr:hypothetical protein [Gemmatimonadota bacterium]
MATSLKRIFVVTAGLSAIGIACGIVLGSIAFWVELWRIPGQTAPEDRLRLALLGAAGGALFGAVLAPIVAWIFLRRVTIGRAIAETSIGVLAGIAVGGLFQPQLTILYALGGFVAAGARLWAMVPEQSADLREPITHERLKIN